jgi:hypothetical protein
VYLDCFQEVNLRVERGAVNNRNVFFFLDALVEILLCDLFCPRAKSRTFRANRDCNQPCSSKGGVFS